MQWAFSIKIKDMFITDRNPTIQEAKNIATKIKQQLTLVLNSIESKKLSPVIITNLKFDLELLIDDIDYYLSEPQENEFISMDDLNHILNKVYEFSDMNINETTKTMLVQ